MLNFAVSGVRTNLPWVPTQTEIANLVSTHREARLSKY